MLTCTNIFIVFWSVAVASLLIFYSNPDRSGLRRYEAKTYWVLSILLVGFAALRPLGSARDDVAYVEIFHILICPSIECEQWLQMPRGIDFGWYSVVGLAKSIFPKATVMLWIGALGLFVKFLVIYRLSRNPLISLVLFSGVFYEVLDLTAWRIALASTVFMAAFWFLVEGRKVIGSILTLLSGIFHAQAFVSLIILVAPVLARRYAWLCLLVMLPMLLLFFQIYPDLGVLSNKFRGVPGASFFVQQSLDSYFIKKADSGYLNWRLAPIVSYPTLLLAVWLAGDALKINQQLYAYSFVSIIVSAWALWAFASLPDVQIRFFDFLILPIVFLAGNCRVEAWRLTGVIVVSGIYVIKYNILHPLLAGGFWL